MNKKLIALAVAAALPVAAHADVTLYGKIKMGVENTKVTEGNNRTNISDIGSRIGFKGAEDLGSGLKAIWQVEQKVNVSDGSASGFATRDSFIGMSSAFGTVKLGKLSNFANAYQGDVDQWEYNGASLGLSSIGVTQARYNNSISYETPEFSGFSAFLHYGQNNAQLSETSKNVGLKYGNGPFKVTYSYEETRADSLSEVSTGDDATKVSVQSLVSKILPAIPATSVFSSVSLGDVKTENHFVEFGYSAENLYVGLAYVNTKTTAGKYSYTVHDNTGAAADATTKGSGNSTIKSQQAALSVSYAMGNLTPKFSYARGFSGKQSFSSGSTNVNKDAFGYDQYVLGADYALSKRTVLGAQAGLRDRHDGGVNEMGYGINLVHKF